MTVLKDKTVDSSTVSQNHARRDKTSWKITE
jgi:hypothetical protein